MNALREWARTAEPGAYLRGYVDHQDSENSRCELSDLELDYVRQILRARDLHLRADDRGLVCSQE